MIDDAFIKGFLEKWAAWTPDANRSRRLGAANIARIRASWAAKKTAPAPAPAPKPEAAPRILPAEPARKIPSNWDPNMTFAGQPAPPPPQTTSTPETMPRILPGMGAPAPSAGGPVPTAVGAPRPKVHAPEDQARVMPALTLQQRAAEARKAGKQPSPDVMNKWRQGIKADKQVMASFTAGFFDEVVKIAASMYEKEFDARTSAMRKKHVEELSRIFDEKVPQRLLAMVRSHFPKFQPLATPSKRLQASTSKTADLQDIIHHPLIQAIGYGALAGEGAHFMASEGHRVFPTSRTAKWLHGKAQSKWGSRAGLGTVGLSSAFLAAEGLSALADLLHKKPSGGTVGGARPLEIRLTLQPPDLPGQSSTPIGRGRDTALRLPRMSPGLRKMVTGRGR